MEPERIGKIIKEIRTKNKLSQIEFAKKYNVTYQAVSKWENGKNLPDLVILKEICTDYNISLDDLVKEKTPKSKIKANKKIIVILLLLIFIFTIVIGFFILKKQEQTSLDFEFKTLSTNCDNFTVSGSIAYNENKSSIYISHITYCGEEANQKYQNIKCTLYEINDKTKTEIGQYNYHEKEKIILEEFLKNVQFKVDNYSKSCQNYSKNSLVLEIDATNDFNNIKSYKIPLTLEDNCTT